MSIVKIKCNKKKTKRGKVPVYSYPGGIEVNVNDLPNNTEYKWV